MTSDCARAVDIHVHSVPRPLVDQVARGAFRGVEVVRDGDSPILSFPGLAPAPPMPPTILCAAALEDAATAQHVDTQLLGPWTDLFGYTLPGQVAADWSPRLQRGAGRGVRRLAPTGADGHHPARAPRPGRRRAGGGPAPGLPGRHDRDRPARAPSRLARAGAGVGGGGRPGHADPAPSHAPRASARARGRRPEERGRPRRTDGGRPDPARLLRRARPAPVPDLHLLPWRRRLRGSRATRRTQPRPGLVGERRRRRRVDRQAVLRQRRAGPGVPAIPGLRVRRGPVPARVRPPVPVGARPARHTAAGRAVRRRARPRSRVPTRGGCTGWAPGPTARPAPHAERRLRPRCPVPGAAG